MNRKLLKIGKTAKLLGISIDTLRRWDKSGKLSSVRHPGGHRYYDPEDIHRRMTERETVNKNLFVIANNWASNMELHEPDEFFYCSNSSVFLARLTKLQTQLSVISELKNIFPLLLAITGEIGDNSFAHNLGNWPDIPGIFFGYDIKKRQIVLADRGQGIFKTLKRVKPEMKSDSEALRVAFTEIISGRAPEERGNGLKFVRSIVTANDIKLYFKSGDAEVKIQKADTGLNIRKSGSRIQGCLAQIIF
jgi:hypothetical protein